MAEHTETLGVDGLNPLSAEQRTAETSLPQDAKFRTGMVSLLAGLIGIMAGIIAYLLYNLIGLLYQYRFLPPRFVCIFVSARENHLGLFVNTVTPVIGGIIVGIMARYGSDKISRSRHPGGNGSGARELQPHRSQSG